MRNNWEDGTPVGDDPMLTGNLHYLSTQALPNAPGIMAALPDRIDVEDVSGNSPLIQYVKSAAATGGFVWSDPQSKRDIWSDGELLRIDVDAAASTVRLSGTSTRAQADAPPMEASDSSVARRFITGPGCTLFEACQTLGPLTASAILENLWSALSPSFIGAELLGYPMVSFGVRFDSARSSRGSAWRAWPDAFLTVPEHVCIRDQETDTTTLLRLSVGTDTRPKSVDTCGEQRMYDESASAAWSDLEMESDWCERVASVLETMVSSNLEKVVLARGRMGRAPTGYAFDAASTIRALWPLRGDATVFSICRGDQTFLGATPEHLVRVQSGLLQTHALAGSVPSGQGDLALDDEKLLREHAHVVDAMRADIGSRASAVTAWPAPQLRSAGKLLHLETELSGQIKDGESLLSLISALHPTPALGGTPRAGALDWLRTNEDLERGYYGAPIGWLAPNGDGVCAVGIRSALIAGEEAWSFAGAGIVEGSNPQAEWDETTLKFTTITDRLRLCGIGDS